jgi:pectate lyase
LKWEGAIAGRSRVSRSVLSQGRAIGIAIDKSSNIEIDNVDIIAFYECGVWVENSSRITITNNWAHHILPKVEEEAKMLEYP